MRRTSASVVFTFVVLVALASVHAGDWAGWRGPNRDGISPETGLLPSWPERGPQLLWQASGLGRGYSSVSIVGDRIYTMGQRGREKQVFVIALHRNDGSEIWATPIPGKHHPNSTPTVDDNRVYAVGATGELFCLNAADGAVVWSKSYGKDFGGKMMSGWGYSESPLVDGELLICTPGAPDALVAALNKHTGDVVWKGAAPSAEENKRGKDGAAYSSVVISHGGGVKQYVQLTGRGVVSYAADDGRLLWNYNKIANGTANIPTPIVDGEYVFCSTGYGTGAALLKLSSDGNNGVNASEVYFLDAKTLQNHHGGMIKVGDYIYCGHGHNNGFPICIEMKTGKVVWGPERGAGSGSAAIVYADGHIYFRYENGTMALVRATPDGYHLDGAFKLAAVNGKSWPHPVIVNGLLYVRDQNDLMCYNLRTK